MTKLICEISASSWFHYNENCYNALSQERKILRIMCAALRAAAIYRLMDCRHLVYKHVTTILVLLLARYNKYYMCKYLERVV